METRRNQSESILANFKVRLPTSELYLSLCRFLMHARVSTLAVSVDSSATRPIYSSAAQTALLEEMSILADYRHEFIKEYDLYLCC